MMTRKELDRLYKELWRGNEEAFIFLLEYFIPFAKYGFEIIEKRGESKLLIRPMVYHSDILNVKLTITHNFEQYQGLGSIDFKYARLSSFNKVNTGSCRKWINFKVDSWLHYYLLGIPAREIPKEIPGSPLPPVKTAFKKRLETDMKLKVLHLRRDGFEPAYSAAFEAFCWEYYGERFFRLFWSESQNKRDALGRYAYEYYRLHYPAKALKREKEWEEMYGIIPLWKICL